MNTKKRDVSATITQEMLAEIEALAEAWDRTLTHTIGVVLRCGMHVANTEPCCRDCGCTQTNACIDDETGESCHWAAEDVCSHCAERAGS